MVYFHKLTIANEALLMSFNYCTIYKKSCIIHQAEWELETHYLSNENKIFFMEYFCVMYQFPERERVGYIRSFFKSLMAFIFIL